MVLKTISPGCRVRASLMLFFKQEIQSNILYMLYKQMFIDIPAQDWVLNIP